MPGCGAGGIGQRSALDLPAAFQARPLLAEDPVLVTAPIGLIRSRARPWPPAARAFWDHLAATAEGAGGGARATPGGG